MDKPTQQMLTQLEDVLQQSVNRQRQLVALLERKRMAMRGGKADEMTSICRLENAVVQAVSELEKRRLKLVADLTLRLNPAATEPLKMLDLAQRLPEPARGRLLVMRTQLVEAIQKVQEQSRVARRASESLLNHMNGLIRTIGVVSSGGAAYGQTGAINSRPTNISTINLTA